MIRFLSRFFPWVTPKVLRSGPLVQGYVRLEMRERGKLVGVREGSNIWTLTGAEYIAELIALTAFSPRTTVRDDRIAYIGVGSGAQAETTGVTALVDPVPYISGEFLAAVAAPATFPSSGTNTSRTSVQFIREFGQNEISLGYDVVLTEAGLFTDGDPDNDWSIPAPTDFTTTTDRAPMAYKTYEPITKTTDFTLRAVWEVRVN